MEPVEGVDLVPKSRWKLVSFHSPAVGMRLTIFFLFFCFPPLFLELLHLQAADGCVHPVQQSELLSGISCYVWTAGEVTHEDEEH